MSSRTTTATPVISSLMQQQRREPTALRVADNLAGYQRLASSDRTAIERLRREVAVPVIEVPRLDRAVHDADGLTRLRDFLFEPLIETVAS